MAFSRPKRMWCIALVPSMLGCRDVWVTPKHCRVKTIKHVAPIAFEQQLFGEFCLSLIHVAEEEEQRYGFSNSTFLAFQVRQWTLIERKLRKAGHDHETTMEPDHMVMGSNRFQTANHVMTGGGVIQAQWDMISWNGKHRNGRWIFIIMIILKHVQPMDITRMVWFYHEHYQILRL